MNIHINGKYYDEEDILAGKNFPQDELLLKAINIIRKWLNGEQLFQMKTSGSTGKPKTIDIHRRQIEASVNFTAQALKLQRNQVSLICLNLDYIAGFMMLIRGLALGMKMIVIPPNANPLQDLQDAENIDFTAMVPLQLQSILELPEHLASLNKMKKILVGGGPVHSEMIRKIQKLDCQVYGTYGMTETVSHIALRCLNGKNKQSWFQAFPEVIIDQDNRGCLTIQSILTNHQKLITNDRVELIDPHRFKWLGRIDNVINSGGIKIQIEPLEEKIASIFTKEGIMNDFLVSGFPDRKLGERVVLVVEGALEKDKTFLLSKLKQDLPPHHAPKDIIVLPHFQRTSTQKIDRKSIQKTLLADAS